MFDLPVKTKQQRGAATAYRELLLDKGFSMVQLSVYVRYFPTGGTNHKAIKLVKMAVPMGGKARIIFITDRQWANMIKIKSGSEEIPEEKPQQLQIF